MTTDGLAGATLARLLGIPSKVAASPLDEAATAVAGDLGEGDWLTQA